MSSLPLFGLLILERDAFVYADFPGLLQVWLQDAGGFAGVGLLVYLVYALRIPPEQAESAKYRAGVTPWMLFTAVAAVLCYAAYFFLVVTGRGPDPNFKPTPTDPTAFVKYTAPQPSLAPQPLALTLGGLFSLLGIGQPFAASLLRMRAGRVWALAKLAFKESVRNRIVWVFLIFLLPFLFPAKWFLSIKPENELRTIINFGSFWEHVLLLVPAVLLAAFAIPNDIKNQNIYTIVTKPVERFEIVLGRFLGYAFLLTLALLGMTAAGVVYVLTSNLDEKAAAETFMARKPLRGKIDFWSRRGQIEGTNVGREFDYRKYIGGDPSSSQRAIWDYASVPARLGRGDAIPLEFTFDIFKMTKGEENRGVDLTIRVTTWDCPQAPPTDPKSGAWVWTDPAREKAYKDDIRAEVAKLGSGFAGKDPETALKRAKPGTALWGVVNTLAEKYGYYEYDGKEVFDYHPDSIDVPAGLFANATKAAPPVVGGKPVPAVRVFVKCNTRGQMLGMAEGDLYFLEEAPRPSPRAFAANYFKWSVGLWCRVMLVLGIAVACSTYLAGVLGLLTTLFLFLSGFFIEHIADLATGKSYVGGPFRAINQLLEAKQATMPSDPGNPLTRVAEGGDTAFAWVVRRFINLVPDLEAYRWTHFLSEGFNIPAEYLVMNVVVLVGYLLPWFVLGFFLIRSREVAE